LLQRLPSLTSTLSSQWLSNVWKGGLQTALSFAL